MANIFTNNSSSLLAVSITGASTSIQVADSSGFPNPSGGDVFYVTLEDNLGNVEIVRISANDLVNTLTVDGGVGGRGIDGTGAQSFTANVTRVEVRLVKSIVDEWLQKGGGVMTGNLDMNANNVIDAKLTGTSTQMLAGEIVNVPLRGAAGVSTNEIVVPTNGTSRATVGGVAILATGDDIVAELDTGGIITLDSASTGVVIPSGAYLKVNDSDNSHEFTVTHDGTNPVFASTSNGDILLGMGLNLQDAVVTSAELLDQSVTEQTVGSSLGILTIDYSLGSYVNVALTENITSIVINNAPANGAVGSLRIKFTQGAGAYTIAWTGYKFAKTPSHSTTTGAIDFVDLWTDDGGTTWYCAMDDNWVTQ